MSALLGYDSKFISDELKEATITVKDLQQILMNGTTIYYILDSNDEKFKAVFQPEFEQALVFLTIGDELKVYYTDDGSFKSIQESNNFRLQKICSLFLQIRHSSGFLPTII